jgi:hypothetical protein
MSAFTLDDGDLADPVVLVSGLDAILQGIEVRLRIVRGEWFANQRLGLPYYPNDIVSDADAILGGKATRTRLTRIRRQVVEMIKSTPGVDRVVEVTLELDGRHLSIGYTAIAGDEVVTGAV